MSALEYTITEVRLPALYEFCKNSLLSAKKDKIVDGQIDFYEHYEPVDPIPWDAEEAYRLYWSYGHFVEIYLLCYEKRIVELWFFWKSTAEQIATAAERLAGE